MTDDRDVSHAKGTRPRLWDRFLTEQDKAHLAIVPQPPRVGFGSSPVLLLVDNWRSTLGEAPLPLLEAARRWPGSMGVNAWETVARIGDLLRFCRLLGVPVIHSTKTMGPNAPVDWYVATRRLNLDPSDPDLVRGVEFAGELQPLPGEVVVTKTGASAFFGSSLLSALHQLKADTVIVTGETTSGCVRATVVDASSHCFHTIVVEDCVYDRHESAHAMNLFDTDQKYGDVLPLSDVKEVLARLHGQTAQDAFSEVVPSLGSTE